MNETDINQVSTCRVGPYKSYTGFAEFDPETDAFHGEVAGTRDVITFQAPFNEIRQAFIDSVDDYLQFCEERNEAPEKPYSGRFLVRLDPDTHRDAAKCAESRGESLNQFVSEAITLALPGLHARNRPAS